MGILALLVDLGFGFYAASGRAWYWYLLGPLLMLVAGSLICSSLIQAMARGYSYLRVHGSKGFPQAVTMLVLNLPLIAAGYGVAWLTFDSQSEIAVFFLACLALSTATAAEDHEFAKAILRTKALEETMVREEANSDIDEPG